MHITMVAVSLIFLTLLACTACSPLPVDESQGTTLPSLQEDLMDVTAKTPRQITADESDLPNDEPDSEEILEEDESAIPEQTGFEPAPRYIVLNSRVNSDYDAQSLFALNDRELPVYDLEAAASEFRPEEVFGDSETELQGDYSFDPIPIYVIRKARSLAGVRPAALDNDSPVRIVSTEEEEGHPGFMRQKRDVVFEPLPTYLIREARAAQRGDYARRQPRPRYYPLFRPRAGYSNYRRPLEIVY